MKAYYGFGIELIGLGKPEKSTMEFAIKTLNRNHVLNKENKDYDVEITNFYMIGDNPNSDIEGGNRMGWTTFLTRSGVFKEGGDTNNATYVVNDLEEALKIIYEKEKLDIKIASLH